MTHDASATAGNHRTKDNADSALFKQHTTTLNILACLYYGSYRAGEYLPITWSSIKPFDIAARESNIERAHSRVHTRTR